MILRKKRWAFVTADPVPQQPLIEELIFVVAGTGGVPLGDPRIVSVDGQDVVLSGIANAFYTIPTLPTVYENQKQVNPFTFVVEIIQVPVGPILNNDYYTSPYWDPYNIAVNPALTLIDEDTYWNMKAAYLQATTFP